MDGAPAVLPVPLPLHNNNTPSSCTLNKRHTTTGTRTNGGGVGVTRDMLVKKEKEKRASFMTWTAEDVAHVAKFHWVPCLFAMGLLFFMGVEYTLLMVPSSSEPFDLGFVATRSLHRVLSASPELNTFLAFLNTVCAFSFFIYLFLFTLFFISLDSNPAMKWKIWVLCSLFLKI